jgi:uncharacterized protein involved in exopolysaccharide biosynthesis
VGPIPGDVAINTVTNRIYIGAQGGAHQKSGVMVIDGANGTITPSRGSRALWILAAAVIAFIALGFLALAWHRRSAAS